MPQQAIAKVIVFQGNSNLLQVLGVQDEITNLFINDISNMVATLVDENSLPVPGAVQVALSYVGGSNGDYQGQYGDNNFYPDVGTGYTFLVDGDNGNAYVHLDLIVEVKPRRISKFS